LDTELSENIVKTSNELVQQDKTISQLHTENKNLKLTNQSLQKDLQLASRLAQSRKVPYPNPENSSNSGQAFLGFFALVLFINLLNSS
jgi:regulator of replication initiation timing